MSLEVLGTLFSEFFFLKNYLDEKGWSPKELLGKCLEKLDKKEYSTSGMT